ncbi:hypothetical protein CCY99_02940 [Helicobacter sp. 16-1353]|uniref:motility associated factor glycosyltransferase family protein n=1 Tax=Helicobacter sp. 16-1353 TaxID=2004996 RepID=UPI000DCE452A|nr:6-hydroxymethylpterin diphosphokinase MptE-like protein [Helicobacter sp. 16-1353]RAX54732.1 hypothetical protein CCY99_02940 [Helicobacter sp. 16-1353]
MDTFKQNLAAISKLDSALATLLLNITPNENLEIFVGKDSADINFFDKKHNIFLFQHNGVEFSINKINEFNEFALYSYLYCFGLGNGIFYKMLLTNKHLKRLIVIEPNIEIIFSVLNLVNLKKELESNRLIILYSKDLNYENLSPFFHKNKNALLYSKLYNLHIFNEYYDIYMSEAMRINRLFIDIIEHGVVAVGNDSKDAITGIKHHIANLPLMLQSPTLLELIAKAKNTNTAIIVSTGPSLYKQLDLLKEIAPYVSIFCIDASFPILCKHDIKPDIVLTMERVEEGAKFYEVVEKEKYQGVIFEITSIAHKRVIQTIQQKGGTIQFSERPFGYTSYFELNEYGYIGIGMSAANMAYELVVHSGFETCIFIGQDLAFGENGKSHSKGAVYGEDEIKKESQNSKILVERYGGGGFVESTRVWKLFLNFFIKDIYDTKDRIKVINATEGGARIPGTIEMSFKKAIANIPKNTPKKTITLTPPNKEKVQENLKNARAKVEHWLSYGKEKKATIEALFLKVVEKTEELERLNKSALANGESPANAKSTENLAESMESKKIAKSIESVESMPNAESTESNTNNTNNTNEANAKNILENFDFKSLEPIFDEIEEIKGLFTNREFMNMFNEATQAYIFHQEMELAKITTTYTKDPMLQKAKQIEWLFAHKAWLFSLAGCLDSVLFCVKDSFESWKK